MTTQLTPTAHSTLGASTSERWCACPGSVKLSEGIPSRTSEYAEEGTLAHEAAAHFLQHNGWIQIEDEMKEAVEVYTSLIRKEKEEEKGAQLFVEVRLDLSSVHPKMFGTADAVIYYPKKKLLRVYDYKHGQGVPVDVLNNPQLMYYGLGAMIQLKLAVEKLELIVVQPRCYHEDGPVRRWEVDAFDLINFRADLQEYAAKTEEPNAPLVMGDHCRWCPAAPICPELVKKAQLAAKTEFAAGISYEPEKLGQILNWLDVFEKWAKNVREFAYGEAIHGRIPPNFKLVAKRASKKWKDGVDSKVLSSATGVADSAFIDYSLISPAQAEKKVPTSEKKKLAEFYTQESTGVVLVPMSDTREAVNMDAKSQFKEIAGPTIDDIL